MANTSFLSRLMHMSWSIQRNKRGNRSQALKAAWVILNNEDIVLYLVAQRMKARRQVKPTAPEQNSLFNPVIL